MFSAIYLVCLAGQPCVFTADNQIYTSLEDCVHYAELTIENNNLRVQNGEIPPFNAEYQCIGWEKA